MEEPSKPWLFRIQIEHTPSFNDPIGAQQFYQALGTLIVAWGRLENHFLACVMAILATNATKDLSQKLPIAWTEREKIWKDAFCLSDDLRPHKLAALAFLAEMHDVAKARSKLVHGLWEPFNPTTPPTPISIGLVVLSRKTETKNGVTHWRGNVATSQVIELYQTADRLNIELQALSGVLSARRGMPPQDIYIP
jgi:hypothetical protein